MAEYGCPTCTQKFAWNELVMHGEAGCEGDS